ncbi:MAG: phosphate/phosphite/phosphonate ABC transporter substrate-binding protein [Chloroflexota bacterium]|nr:phosphate/phosphite/phosphonate ABC transporter substrate-binding protein [Chloroflexota bacterium]
MKKIGIVLGALVVFALFSIGLVVAQEATPEMTPEMMDRTDWPERFILGVYPGDNVEEALASIEPLRVYLEEQLGIPVELVTGTSYTAVIEAMRAGNADGMEVGPFSYVLAAQEANAEAIAVANFQEGITVEQAQAIDTEALPGYYSLLFTLKGSGIASIADLAGRSFAFTDPASTSGYLIPATSIMTAMTFEEPTQIEEFAEIVFAGNHPSAVLSVANGTTDAGATFDGSLPAQADEGLIELCGYDAETGEFPYYNPMTQAEIDAIYEECPEGNIVVFAQSSVIPETPFAVRGDLPESFKAAVKTALLAIASDTDLVVAIERFYVDPSMWLGLESLDNLYDGLRDTATLLDLDLNAR